MREVFIALGLALMLSSVPMILYGAHGLWSVDRFEELREDNTPDWYSDNYVDITEPVTDRVRSFFIASLAGGLFLLVLGAALALHGLRQAKTETPSDALVFSTAPSGERGFCDYCGGPIDPSTIRCPTCGRVLKST